MVIPVAKYFLLSKRAFVESLERLHKLLAFVIVAHTVEQNVTNGKNVVDGTSKGYLKIISLSLEAN